MSTNTRTQKEIDQLRDTLAEVLGEAPGTIRAANPRWVQLLKEGVIIKIHISRWRASVALQDSDLGIGYGDEEMVNDIVNLGEKFLLPQTYIKKFNSIDAGSRTHLKNSGFDTYWGVLIPVTNYQTFRDENQEFQDRYWELATWVCDHWDDVTDELVQEYIPVARNAYRRRKQLDANFYTGKDWLEEDQYVDRWIQNLLSIRPSAEQVRKTFGYSLEMNYVPLPSLLEDDLAKAQINQAEVEIQRREMFAESEGNRVRREAEMQVEVAELKAQEAEYWAKEMATRTVGQERQSMLKEMNKDMVEVARIQKEELVNEFMVGVVSQLRGLVYKVAEDVAESIENNGTIHPRKIVQLKNLIKQVDTLNFYGDADIEKMMAPIKAQLNEKPEERNPAELAKSLGAIGTLVRSSLIGLGETPRKSRVVSIPAKPTANQKRQARQQLGLEVEPQPAQKRQSRAVVMPVMELVSS